MRKIRRSFLTSAYSNIGVQYHFNNCQSKLKKRTNVLRSKIDIGTELRSDCDIFDKKISNKQQGTQQPWEIIFG